MKPKLLKKIVARTFAGCFLRLQNALHKHVCIDDANHVTLRVHHRKGEKFVKNKKLARLENGRLGRQGDHAWHHDLSQNGRRRGRKQTTRRNNADQAATLVNGVEINYPFADSFAPNRLKRFLHAGPGLQKRKILPRVLQRQRVEIGCARKLHHRAFLTLCTMPLSRKTVAASAK